MLGIHLGTVVPRIVGVEGRDRAMVYHSDHHTYFPSDVTRSPSTIDLCLVKGFLLPASPVSVDALWSDHNPIVFPVSTGTVQLVNRLDTSRTDWRQFRQEVSSRLSSNALQHEISRGEQDQIASDFDQIIIDSFTTATPRLKYPRMRLPPEIRYLMNCRNRLKRLSQALDASLAARIFYKQQLQLFG